MVVSKRQGWGVKLRCDVEPSGWRSCGRELFYVAVVAFAVHAVVRQHVQGPLCGSCAAQPLPTPGESQGGACSLLAGCPGTPTWSNKVLCDALWHGADGAITPGLGGYATAVSRAPAEALGFLWQPLSLAWMSADPHYLAHATAAILLGAAVIWPTLYGTQVTQATRVAARAAARLLFLATSYMSVTTPYGLLQFHLPAVMASQGRWVLFACMAWVQGALLQVPPLLQLPLSLLEWWVVSIEVRKVQEALGFVAPTWQQQLLEALLVVGVPWVPLLLQLAWQHAASKRRSTEQQQQGRARSHAASSSSSSGASKHLLPGNKSTMVGPEQRPAGPNGQTTGVANGSATPTCAGTPEAAHSERLVSTPVQPVPREEQPSTSTSTSTSSYLVRHNPSAAAVKVGSSDCGRQAGSCCSVEVPMEQTPVMDLLQQLLEGYALPAAAQLPAAAAAGALQLPIDMRYTPYTCMVPVSVKVPSPPGMSYTTAAARVMAAMGGEFNRQGPSGVLVHAMTTFPGCVLWLGELVQAAGQHSGRGLQLASDHHHQQQQQQQQQVLGAAETAEDLVLYLPAVIQQVWLVPLAAHIAPGGAGAVAPATSTAGAAGTRAPVAAAAGGAATQAGGHSTWLIQGLPASVTPALQHELQEALLGPAHDMEPNSSRFLAGAPSGAQEGQGTASTGGSPMVVGDPAAIPDQCAGPYTSCVVATWGQPVTLQLLDVAACSGGETAGAGGTVGQVGAYRVVAMHQETAVMDEVVDVSYSSSTGGRSTCPSLTITCISGQAGTPADTPGPAVVSVYLIPATDSPGDAASSSSGSNSSSNNHHTGMPTSAASNRGQACLPVAHVVVLLLPPEPAAELSGWVAAHCLPLHLVAAWGADLAVLVGCADQLTAAAAAAATQLAGRHSTPSAGATQRLVSMSQLATAVAGTLRPFLDTHRLAAASDLVAVLQQRVLVGATALQPMAAGRVVPAAPSATNLSAAGSTSAIATRAAAEGWAMSGTERAAHQVPVLPVVLVSVTMAGSGTQSQHSMSDAPAQVGSAGLSLPRHVRQASLAADAASTGSTSEVSIRSSSSSSSDSGSGSEGGSNEGNTGASSGGRSCPAAPLHYKNSPGASDGASKTAAEAAGCSKGATSAPCKALSQQPTLQLQPAEEAALTGSWWAALPLCWRGFRGVPGAERSYQEFRAAFLWRWDLGLRGYHFLVSVAMTAKTFDHPQTKAVLWGWGGLSVAICIAELAVHVLLLLAAPSWWGRHRDAVLATFHLRAGCIWIWQVLAWPPSLFCVVFGSGAQLLLVPVSLLLSPTSPRAGLLGSACITPLAYTSLLLLSARAATGNVGLAALQAGVQARRTALVWGGMAFTLLNYSVVMLVGMVMEVAIRRAWVRKQRRGQQQQAALCYSAAQAEGGSAGPSCAGW